MRIPQKFISALALLLFLATSCQMQDKNFAVEPQAEYVTEAAYKEEATSPTTSDEDVSNKAMQQLKLIRTANIRMEVTDYRATAKAIHAYTKRSGGFVSSERATGDATYNETVLNIRVPNQAFDSLAARIVSRAARLEYKNICTKDVTEEYVDLQARIKTKKASEETYQTILRSSKKIADVLEVQNHIRHIREEIEVAEGRLRYLTDRVSLSTISVTFFESHPVQAVAASSDGFGNKIKVGFLEGWHAIQNGIIALTYAWPLLLLIVLAFFLIRKRILSKKSTNSTIASI